jgi:transcriptional regulator with XRE-family HTH domain
MNETYLPGSARERILDLMKHQKVTQKDLAQRIDITESALSRFLSGATDRLDSEYLLRIARCFGVSTDFLLGETAVPDRKNYEIVELGLSAQAARNLYTGRACPEVVNRLLESPRFAELTYLLQLYFNGTLAEGFAAQNQLLATLSSAVLSGTENKTAAQQAAKEIKRSRIPEYQADLTQIQNQFLAAITEVKKEYAVDFSAAQAMTKKITEKMFSEFTKGQDLPEVKITPKSFAEAVTSVVSDAGNIDEDAFADFRNALEQIATAFSVPPKPPDDETAG